MLPLSRRNVRSMQKNGVGHSVADYESMAGLDACDAAGKALAKDGVEQSVANFWCCPGIS
jgi:hypothetical protein